MLKNNPFNPNVFISEHLKNSPYTKLDYESFRPIPQKIIDKDLQSMGFFQTFFYILKESMHQFSISFAKSCGEHLGIALGLLVLFVIIYFTLIALDKHFSFKVISLPGNIKLER